MDDPDTQPVAVSQDDEFVVIQTENGHQICIPGVALPDNFDPHQADQVIFEEIIDTEQQEIIVETVVHETREPTPTPLIPLVEPVPQEGGDQIEETSDLITKVESPKQPVRQPYIPKEKQPRKQIIKVKELIDEDMRFEFTFYDEEEEPIEYQFKPKQEPNVQQAAERRTRLSNSYRVATSKHYKCNDCGFSTDRINNIVSHVKTSKCKSTIAT